MIQLAAYSQYDYCSSERSLLPPPASTTSPSGLQYVRHGLFSTSISRQIAFVIDSSAAADHRQRVTSHSGVVGNLRVSARVLLSTPHARRASHVASDHLLVRREIYYQSALHAIGISLRFSGFRPSLSIPPLPPPRHIFGVTSPDWFSNYHAPIVLHWFVWYGRMRKSSEAGRDAIWVNITGMIHGSDHGE